MRKFSNKSLAVTRKWCIFNPAQQRILHLMSYIKTEEELDGLEKALSKYFASKVDEGMDALCEQGLITPETIDEWGHISLHYDKK